MSDSYLQELRNVLIEIQRTRIEQKDTEAEELIREFAAADPDLIYKLLHYATCGQLPPFNPFSKSAIITLEAVRLSQPSMNEENQPRQPAIHSGMSNPGIEAGGWPDPRGDRKG